METFCYICHNGIVSPLHDSSYDGSARVDSKMFYHNHYMEMTILQYDISYGLSSIFEL